MPAVAAAGPLAGSSPAQAKRIVLVSGVGAGILSTVAVVRRGAGDTNRMVLRVAAGATVATALLAAVAEFAPQLAAGFAALLLVTAAFVVGGDAWTGITAITSR